MKRIFAALFAGLMVACLLSACGGGAKQLESPQPVPMPETETSTSVDIISILTSNEWVRTAPAGNLITMTLYEDGTGVQTYGSADLEDSTIEWQIDSSEVITMTIHMFNGDASTENKLEEKNGVYRLYEISENGAKVIDLEEQAWSIK